MGIEEDVRAKVTRNSWITHPPRNPRRNSAAARKRRKELLGEGAECHVCGRTDGPFDIDHVEPLCLGGADEPDNLAPICRSPCHKRKTGAEGNVVRWIINRRHMDRGHGG